ncbi:TPA: hypothetical protein ACH3X1_010766 [Trebouxia sp. C0004]
MSEDECALSWLSWILLPPEQVPSWLGDPLMWCYGLPEDMASFPRPTNWVGDAMFTGGANSDHQVANRAVQNSNTGFAISRSIATSRYLTNAQRTIDSPDSHARGNRNGNAQANKAATTRLHRTLQPLNKNTTKRQTPPESTLNQKGQAAPQKSSGKKNINDEKMHLQKNNNDSDCTGMVCLQGGVAAGFWPCHLPGHDMPGLLPGQAASYFTHCCCCRWFSTGGETCSTA